MAAAAMAAAFTGAAPAFMIPGSPPPAPGVPRNRAAAATAAEGPTALPAAPSSQWPRFAAAAAAVMAATQVTRRRKPGHALVTGNSPAACLSTSRGQAKAASTARGSKIVRGKGRTRVPRGPYAVYRRRAMYLDYTRHMKGNPSKIKKFSRLALMKALKHSYKDRRVSKRNRRSLNIMRCGNNARLHGVAYNALIHKLKEKRINLNRKVLAQLGSFDRAIFTTVLEYSFPGWKRRYAHFNTPPQEYSVQQIDDLIIPHVEKIFPDMYTDEHVRFNRKERDGMIDYTVDVGDPEGWRQLLPRKPELANFNVPDHFLQDSNAPQEKFELEWLRPAKPEYQDEVWKAFKWNLKDREKVPEERKTKKIDRSAWFVDEPQSWF